METIKWTLRDEILNIFAMTYGGLPQRSHQIFICKKNPIKGKAGLPLLLDTKKNHSIRYALSDTGRWYKEKIREKELGLKYIAYIDSQIEITPHIELFESLYENGFFHIWKPFSPIDYFGCHNLGYIVTFRVLELDTPVHDIHLTKGRSGRNFIYRLTEEHNSTIKRPVITESIFLESKKELLEIIKENKAFIGFYREEVS